MGFGVRDRILTWKGAEAMQNETGSSSTTEMRGRGGRLGGVAWWSGVVGLTLGGVVLGVLMAEPMTRWWGGQDGEGASSMGGGGEGDGVEGRGGGGEGEGGVTLYQSGMHPWIVTTEPGNCPICGMKLEPIDASKLTGEVAIDPVVVQNLGVRTAEVVAGPLTRSVRTVGTVEVAEPRVGDVNLRVSGWIESLGVDFVGARVERGERLFDLYSPELYAAQEEFLLARRRSGGNAELERSARDR